MLLPFADRNTLNRRHASSPELSRQAGDPAIMGLHRHPQRPSARL
jgi:hypothetical protein